MIAAGFGTRLFYVSHRRLRHPRQPAPGPPAAPPATGRRRHRFLHPARPLGAVEAGRADDLLRVRPPGAGERQPGDRPRRRLVPVRGGSGGQGGRRRRAPEPGPGPASTPATSGTTPTSGGSTPPCWTDGSGATAPPSSAARSSRSRSSRGPEAVPRFPSRPGLALSRSRSRAALAWTRRRCSAARFLVSPRSWARSKVRSVARSGRIDRSQLSET